jgi:hypothetical protein
VGVRILPTQDHQFGKRRDVRVRGARFLQGVFYAPEVAFAIAIERKILADCHAHGRDCAGKAPSSAMIVAANFMCMLRFYPPVGGRSS